MPEEPDDSDGEGRDRAPPDDRSDGRPQGEQPPNQSEDGQPPNQPQGRQPPNQPEDGQPPNQPQGRQPPNQPQGRQSQGQTPNQPQPPNQPQGGQSQGQTPNQPQPPNRPQGGQSQGQTPNQPQPPNRPQGGRSRGQVGGQQRRGQPPAGQVQTGLDVDTAYLQEWATYFAALFGVAGFSTGLIWIFVGAADQPILEPSDTFGGALSLLIVQSIIVSLLLVVAVTAVFLGAWLGRKLDEDDNEAFVTAGVSVAAGAAVFFFLISILLSFGFDDLSLSFGGILINTILTALLAGATTAGGAAVTRNLAPRDL